LYQKIKSYLQENSDRFSFCLIRNNKGAFCIIISKKSSPSIHLHRRIINSLTVIAAVTGMATTFRWPSIKAAIYF
ncbi:MAG: hypothetical protein ACU88J_10550, partial [Gammaproteobacteria bacterium]